MTSIFMKKFLNALCNLLGWKRFESLREQLFTKFVSVKFMWSNNVLLSVLVYFLENKQQNTEEDEDVILENENVINSNVDIDESFSIMSFISNHSTSLIIFGIVILIGLGIGYHQGYIFNSPYIFTKVHSDWDFSKYPVDLLEILEKPVKEWTYSDMLLIEFYKPEVYNFLDFSKLDPQLACKFFSFFKSTNLKDIRFNVPEKYLEYVLDRTGTIVPKEFEPYHLDCMNNIIIDWKLADPNIIKEIKEILPLVLDNPNADPNLVAKILQPDYILITRQVLRESFNIHPSLIELHISPEIMELAQEILASGVF